MRPIAIIGTGSYGIALGRRLLEAELQIHYGSRNPNPACNRRVCEELELDSDNTKFRGVLPIDEAWSNSTIVFLAISVESYKDLIAEISKLKKDNSSNRHIVVDISNRSIDQLTSDQVSNAEYLEELFKEAGLTEKIDIVKCKTSI